jgi:hypothetical protein
MKNGIKSVENKFLASAEEQLVSTELALQQVSTQN